MSLDSSLFFDDVVRSRGELQGALLASPFFIMSVIVIYGYQGGPLR